MGLDEFWIEFQSDSKDISGIEFPYPFAAIFVPFSLFIFLLDKALCVEISHKIELSGMATSSGMT